MNAKTCLTCALFLITATAPVCYAGSVLMYPATISAEVGETFGLDVILDFGEDITLGGAFNIHWDANALAFVGWTFDTSTVMGDPDFTLSGDLFDGVLEYVGTASLNGLVDGVIGTAMFLAVAPGATTVFLSMASDPGPSSWVSAINFQDQFPNFVGADILVRESVVPLPASVWMLLGALGVLRAYTGALQNTT